MGQIYLVTNTDDNNGINPAAYILKYIGENRFGGTTFANLDEALTACDTRWQELGWISSADECNDQVRQMYNDYTRADSTTTSPHSQTAPTSSTL